MRCCDLSEDGQFLFCANSLGQVLVYCLRRFERILEQQVHQDSEITSLSVLKAPEGHFLLATGSKDRSLRLSRFDPAQGRYLRLLTAVEQEHSSSVLDLLLTLSDEHLILTSISQDRSLIVRALRLGQPSLKFTIVHEEPNQRQQFKQILSGPRQQVLVLQERQLTVLTLERGAFSGKQVLETPFDPEPFQGHQPSSASTHALTVSNVFAALDNSQTLICIASSDKYLRIRDLQDGRVLQRLCLGDVVSSLFFNLEDSKVLAASAQGLIYCWGVAPEVRSRAARKLKKLSKVSHQMREYFLEQSMLQSK